MFCFVYFYRENVHAVKESKCIYSHLLTLFSSGHVLLQFQFLLAQLQYAVFNAVLTNQFYHLYSPDTHSDVH